ncbi:MAG: CYTH domain-containing protein [Firmicutes bacterium]|nr:CYTH domain-containing protein [Bacillota bacterium]
MEIELKYRIPDEDIAARIWEDSLFSEIEEEDSREEISLYAIYYDTSELDLARNKIAYRVRREDDRMIATLKWSGKSEDGLHVREELTVPVSDSSPDVSVFLESDIGEELEPLIRDKEMIELIRTDIRRRRFRIDTGEGIFEVSVDEGDVFAGDESTPVREVEVELFSGETEELVEIGRRLQEVYGLEPEDTSKYAKGIELICHR